MIPLMKNTFLNEFETKKSLSQFILKADKLSMGEKCDQFEKEFARFQGRKHAILLNSGGSANLALLQALKNLGRLKNDDKVGFSALTWATNTMPIIQMGMEPVPVDCSPSTLNVMCENIEKRIEEQPLDCFFATNVLGFCGDLDKVKTLCEEKGILFIEDNCESLGSSLKGTKAGNFSLAATFSFFVAHHMSTVEGGMICTDDDELAEMLLIVRANGWDRNLKADQQIKWRKKFNISSEFQAKYTFYDLGFNVRPTEITGFLGLEQLKYLPENIETRQRNFLKIRDAIQNNDDIIDYTCDYMDTLSMFAMPILCKTAELRDKYLNQFSGAGIEIRPMIAGNIQDQPFYPKYVEKKYNLDGTSFIHNNGFYCGNYPEMTEVELETIVSCLTQY